jgi:hypothetical protein
MGAPIIRDLTNIEVEHLLGLHTGLPLVKVRAEADGVVLVGQISPDDARQIAAHLFECAARAEYEHDFVSACQAHDLPADVIGINLTLIREGEQRRHTGGQPNP